MLQSFIPGRRKFLAAGAAALCVAPAAVAQPAASGGEVTLKQLLDDSRIPYAVRQGEDGTRYLMRIDTGTGVTEPILRELTMRWKRPDGSAVKAAFLYVPAVRFPATFAPSAPLLKLLADLNNDLVFGNVGIGKYGIFYSNSMWLRNADVPMFGDVIALAHHQTLEVRERCQPFVKSS